jgi:hypothetical protein
MASQQDNNSSLPANRPCFGRCASAPGEGRGESAFPLTLNQLGQVFRTYCTRLYYWYFFGAWLFFMVLLIPTSQNPVANPDFIFPLVFANWFVGFVVASQIKYHFANPMARLLPGFALAHMIVAVVIVGSAVVIESAITAQARSVSFFATAGFSLLVLVCILLHFYFLRAAFAILFPVLMLTALYAPKYVAAPVIYGDPVVSAALFCIGLGLIVLLGVRLLTLNEARPEYSKQPSPYDSDITSRPAGRGRRRAESQAVFSGHSWRDFLFKLVFRRLPAWGPLRRLLLFQVAFGFPGLYVPLGVALLYCLSFLEKPPSPPAHGTINVAPAFDPLSFGVLMFSVLLLESGGLGAFWLARWPYLVRESLLPRSRGTFVRDLLRSSLLDIVLVGSGLSTASSYLLQIGQPHGFTLVFFASLIQYVLMGSMMFLVISCRDSLLLVVIGILVTDILSTTFLTSAVYSSGWIGAAALSVTSFVIIVGICGLAFWRWSNVDFD